MSFSLLKKLFFVLCLLSFNASSSMAVEFAVKGTWQIGFEHSNVAPRYKDGKDSFGALQRFRTQLDVIASPALSGAIQFEIGENNWGNASEGAALGADGKTVAVRFAYLDWIPPMTDIKVRMGLQFLQLPGLLSQWGFGAVFGHDMAGISISSPIYKSTDLNIDATFFWARPYNDNSSSYYTTTATSHLDNLDLFALSIPIRSDNFSINPWVLYGLIGKYSLTGLTAADEPAQVVPRSGLMPVIGGTYVNGFQQYVRSIDQAYGHGLWAGLCASYRFNDAWTLGIEGAFGSVYMGQVKNYQGFQDGTQRTLDLRRQGWYVGARLDYKADWGTPGIIAWYGPGDDGNPYNGSERLPSFNTPWGVTSLAFGGGITDSMTWKVLGHNPSGMAAVVVQVADVSFIEDLTHTFRFGHYWGTNSCAMPRKANMTWPSRADGPVAYLTTTDTAWELNLVNRYKIYENLEFAFEAAYVRLNLDGDTWRGAEEAELKDNYRISALFTYSF